MGVQDGVIELDRHIVALLAGIARVIASADPEWMISERTPLEAYGVNCLKTNE